MAGELDTLLANINPETLGQFFHNMMSESSGKAFLWETLCVMPKEARVWLRNASEWSHETVTGAKMEPAPPLPR